MASYAGKSLRLSSLCLRLLWQKPGIEWYLCISMSDFNSISPIWWRISFISKWLKLKKTDIVRQMQSCCLLVKADSLLISVPFTDKCGSNGSRRKAAIAVAPCDHYPFPSLSSETTRSNLVFSLFYIPLGQPPAGKLMRVLTTVWPMWCKECILSCFPVEYHTPTKKTGRPWLWGLFSTAICSTN